jgi:hypothetical protein
LSPLNFSRLAGPTGGEADKSTGTLYAGIPEGKQSHKSGISQKDSVKTAFSETQVLRGSRYTNESGQPYESSDEPVARVSQLRFNSPSARNTAFDDPFGEPKIWKKES